MSKIRHVHFTPNDQRPTTTKCDLHSLSVHIERRQIVNAMGQGLTVTNSQRRLEFVNPALASMLGYEPSELAGMSADEIIVAEDCAMQSAHQATRRAGHTTSCETYLQRRDGSAVLVQVTGAPRFVNGEFVGSIAVVTDMTERNLAGKALRHSEKRFRTLIESSPDPSIIHREQIIIYANPAAFKLYGAHSAQQLIGKSVVDFVHPDFLPVARAAAGHCRRPNGHAVDRGEKCQM